MYRNKDIDISVNYLIEDKIEYSPSNNTLRSLIDDTKITLLAAASECLLLLLINHGKLICKKELVYSGWEQYGLHVSDNTFYQNILMLRKGIKCCGIDNEVIKTIPRKGLLIPITINIKAISEEHKPIQSSERNLLAEPNNTSPEVTFPIVLKKSDSAVKRFCLACYIFVFFMVLLLSSYYTLPNNYTSDYQDIDVIDNCQVSIDSKYSGEKEYRDFLIKKSFKCKSGDFIYFTTYPYIQRISVVACQKKITNSNNENDCTSYYYLD